MSNQNGIVFRPTPATFFNRPLQSPELSSNAGIYSHDDQLGLWAARISLWSSTENESASASLTLYGNGYETVSATILNGYVGVDKDLEYPAGSGQYVRYLSVVVNIIGDYDENISHYFDVHMSGSCRPSYPMVAPMDDPLDFQ